MITASKFLMRVVASVMFLVAGFSFLFGGRLISDYLEIDRMIAEVIGIIIAMGFGWLGYLAKTAEARIEREDEDETSVRGNRPQE